MGDELGDCVGDELGEDVGCFAYKMRDMKRVDMRYAHDMQKMYTRCVFFQKLGNRMSLKLHDQFQ